MRNGTQLPIEQKIEIAKDICNVYSLGKYTLESCCKKNGISYSTLYLWVKTIKEIEELFYKAKQQNIDIYKEQLREKALTSLEKRVKGYSYTETKTVTEKSIDGTDTIKEIVKTKKEVLPDPGLIKFAILNTMPEGFEDKTQLDLEATVIKRVIVDPKNDSASPDNSDA